MATTTPDNIYSPDPNTLYNFVTDLRNMAVSIQTALSRRVSGLRGTTAERNAALSSTPVEATWFDTTTNLWYVRGTSSWVEAGPNSFRGPTTARDSYPNPKPGMLWYDTSLGRLTWRTPTAWRVLGNVSGSSERDTMIPSPAAGMKVFREDTNTFESYRTSRSLPSNPFGPQSSGWFPDDRTPLDSFSLLSNGVPSGSVTSITPGSRVSAESNSQFLTVSGNNFSVTGSGVFSITGVLRLNAATTGRTFIDVLVGGVVQGRFGVTNGEDQAAFTLPAVILNSGNTIMVQVFKNTNPAVTNVSGSFRVTRIGSF